MIEQLRALIARKPESSEAVEALQIIFSLVRSDWQDKLDERATIFNYLQGLYSSYSSLLLGQIALQLMIVERMSWGRLMRP